jgi:hypothetical protein
MTGLLFTLSFVVAAPFWALMIVLPGWSWTSRIVSSPLIVLPVVLIYAALILPDLTTVFPAVAAPTPAGVRSLLGTAGGAAAWAHMIAFDLFVGRWAWLDGRTRRIPALVMSPILLLTILLGPLGLLAFLAVRSRWPHAGPAAAEVAAAPARPQRLG